MKLRKLLAILIAFFLVVFAIDRLWISTLHHPENQIYTWLDPDGTNAVVSSLIEQAKANDPDLDVTFRGVQRLDYYQTLDSALKKSDAPCLVTLPAMQTEELKDNLLPLNDLITSVDADISRFAKVAIDGMNIDGQQYGLPYSVSVVHLFYNKDLFKQANRKEPSTDYTWTTFRKDVDAIGALGEDYYGYSASPRIFDATIIGMLYAENDRTFINNKFNLDSQTNIQTLKRIFELFADPKVFTPHMNVGEPSFADVDKFLEGKTGMVAGGQWLPKYIADHGDINLGYAVLPSLNGKPKGVFSGSGLAINRSCDRPKQAFRVMGKLLNKHALEMLGKDQKVLPALGDLAGGVEDFMEPDQIKVVQYLLDNGINLEFSTSWNNVDKRWAELTKAHTWGTYDAEAIVNDIMNSYGK